MKNQVLPWSPRPLGVAVGSPVVWNGEEFHGSLVWSEGTDPLTLSVRMW